MRNDRSKFVYAVTCGLGEDPVLHKVAIAVLTAKQIKLSQRPLFNGCRLMMPRKDACFTAEDAIRQFVAGQEQEAADYERAANEARRQVEAAKKLERMP